METGRASFRSLYSDLIYFVLPLLCLGGQLNIGNGMFYETAPLLIKGSKIFAFRKLVKAALAEGIV